MTKLNHAVVTLVFAVLGGCASNPGDMIGTGFSVTNNPTTPYPEGPLVVLD